MSEDDPPRNFRQKVAKAQTRILIWSTSIILFAAILLYFLLDDENNFKQFVDIAPEMAIAAGSLGSSIVLFLLLLTQDDEFWGQAKGAEIPMFVGAFATSIYGLVQLSNIL